MLCNRGQQPKPVVEIVQVLKGSLKYRANNSLSLGIYVFNTHI